MRPRQYLCLQMESCSKADLEKCCALLHLLLPMALNPSCPLQMEGSGLADREDWGLIPFAVDELLRRVGQARAGSYLVTLSYVELYREQLTDLLSHPGKGEGASAAVCTSSAADCHAVCTTCSSLPMLCARCLQLAAHAVAASGRLSACVGPHDPLGQKILPMLCALYLQLAAHAVAAIQRRSQSKASCHCCAGPGSKLQPLQLKQNAEGNFEVEGLREEPIRDLEQVRQMLTLPLQTCQTVLYLAHATHLQGHRM